MITEQQTAALDKKRAEKKEKEVQDSPSEKREVVMHGASLSCKYAQGLGKLFVTSNELLLQDQKWATEGDGNNMVNLQFKGTCGHPKWPQRKMSPPPCMSVIKLSPWQNLGTNFLQEQKNLVKESYIECEPEFNTATAKPIPTVASIVRNVVVKNEGDVIDAYFARLKDNKYERILWAGIEEEIYVIVKTIGLAGKSIEINILDREATIVKDKYCVLAVLQDGADKKGEFKTSVNDKGEAIFKLQMKPSADEKAIKLWRDKISGSQNKKALLCILVDAHTSNPDFKINYSGKNPSTDNTSAKAGMSNYFLDMEGKWFELRRKNPVIVIDAGHGGDDGGTPKINGNLNEADITLAVSNHVVKKLISLGADEAKILRTRQTNINPGGKGQKASLKARVDFSTKNLADIFVAIHVDSADNKNVDKVTVRTQLVSNDNSKKLSSNIANALIPVVISTNGVKETPQDLFVCRSQPKIASVLVEIGFMTNENQEKLMNTDAYQEKIGNAIAEGIHKTEILNK
jgi:N-acetylmuramoyl-L-alanine amidase